MIYNRQSDKIYIGCSKSLEKRLEQHNEKKGNHYTAKIKGSWIVIYKERLATKKEALKREKQLKSYKGREFIKQFIPRK